MAMALLPLLALLATAQSIEVGVDPRIRSIPYDPDQVVRLSVIQGFASVVELGGDERVENVVVGNSADWQVTANHAGTRVIVKPLAGAMATNLVVLTATRRYVFFLDPNGETAFVLRFTYPEKATAAVPVASSSTYKFRGDRALFPAKMYDDGRRTVILWKAQNALPAIYALNDGRDEQLVNGRMIGDAFVIDGTASRYRFRYGRAEAVAMHMAARRGR